MSCYCNLLRLCYLFFFSEIASEVKKMGGNDAKRIKFHMKTGTVMYELVHINNNIIK